MEVKVFFTITAKVLFKSGDIENVSVNVFTDCHAKAADIATEYLFSDKSSWKAVDVLSTTYQNGYIVVPKEEGALW